MTFNFNVNVQVGGEIAVVIRGLNPPAEESGKVAELERKAVKHEELLEQLRTQVTESIRRNQAAVVEYRETYNKVLAALQARIDAGEATPAELEAAEGIKTAIQALDATTDTVLADIPPESGVEVPAPGEPA